MQKLNSLTSATELELVVSFFDLTGFAKLTRTQSSMENFEFLSEYYEFTGDLLQRDGGMIIKFMGDGGLAVFPASEADAAVRHLKRFKDEGDRWLQDKHTTCRQIIKAHVGPVICGRVGPRDNKQLDVFGDTVMTAASMKSNGLAITPQLFRKLSPDTRKLLKKHTPPITYISVEESHRN